jgi:hypothetical protein
MAKYRKKPVVIEAFHMTRRIWNVCSEWPDSFRGPVRCNGYAMRECI